MSLVTFSVEDDPVWESMKRSSALLRPARENSSEECGDASQAETTTTP
jgi:hypothetical protein